MEIKVVQEGDCVSVNVINPATQECVSTTHLSSGQSLTLTLPEVHDASGVQVGEPAGGEAEPTPEPPAEEPAPEPEPTPEPEPEPSE